MIKCTTSCINIVGGEGSSSQHTSSTLGEASNTVPGELSLACSPLLDVSTASILPGEGLSDRYPVEPLLVLLQILQLTHFVMSYSLIVVFILPQIYQLI